MEIKVTQVFALTAADFTKLEEFANKSMRDKRRANPTTNELLEMLLSRQTYCTVGPVGYQLRLVVHN